MFPADSTTAIGLLGALVSDAQVDDPIYVDHPEWGQRPGVLVKPDVSEVHVHPGIAFIRKAHAAEWYRRVAIIEDASAKMINLHFMVTGDL